MIAKIIIEKGMTYAISGDYPYGRYSKQAVIPEAEITLEPDRFSEIEKRLDAIEEAVAPLKLEMERR